jgi:uncharacterized membrane protein
VIAQYIEERYTGPIPHPAILRQIDEIVPGSAREIIDNAHNQTAHRQGLENKYLDAAIDNSKRGQILGFIIGMTAIIGGMLLVAFDKWVGGLAFGLPGLATLVGVFVYSRIQQNLELRESRRAFPSDVESIPGEQTEVEGESQ